MRGLWRRWEALGGLWRVCEALFNRLKGALEELVGALGGLWRRLKGL